MTKHLAGGPQSILMDQRVSYFTEYGARILADRIRAYWAKHGMFPKVWVAAEPSLQSATDRERIVYVVRSDMRNGRPQ